MMHIYFVRTIHFITTNRGSTVQSFAKLYNNFKGKTENSVQFFTLQFKRLSPVRFLTIRIVQRPLSGPCTPVGSRSNPLPPVYMASVRHQCEVTMVTGVGCEAGPQQGTNHSTAYVHTYSHTKLTYSRIHTCTQRPTPLQPLLADTQ